MNELLRQLAREVIADCDDDYTSTTHCLDSHSSATHPHRRSTSETHSPRHRSLSPIAGRIGGGIGGRSRSSGGEATLAAVQSAMARRTRAVSELRARLGAYKDEVEALRRQKGEGINEKHRVEVALERMTADRDNL